VPRKQTLRCNRRWCHVADAAAAALPVSPRTVLVTGAAGGLGREVVAALVAAGHAVRAGVRRPLAAVPPDWGSAVVQVPLDMLDDAGWPAAVAGIDAVIHLAAAMGADDAEQLRVALDGTRRLLGHVAAAAPSAQVVLASSFVVYDWTRVGAELTEDSPLLTRDQLDKYDGYTRAKAEQEWLARDLCRSRQLALTVLRPATVWHQGFGELSLLGPGSGTLTVVVRPSRTLRLTHRRNCAAAFVAALDPRAVGHTFNIDDGYAVSAWRFAALAAPGRRLPMPYWTATLLARTGALLARRLRPGRPLPGLLVPERLHTRFHAARAGHAALRRVLGWQPAVTLEQGAR